MDRATYWKHLLSIAPECWLDETGDMPERREDVRAVAVHNEDGSSNVITEEDVGRYLIKQEDAFSGTFLITEDTVAGLEAELAHRIEEDGWTVTGVYDLATGKELFWETTVKVQFPDA